MIDDDFDIEPIYCNKCKIIVPHEIYRFQKKDKSVEIISTCELCGKERRVTIEEDVFINNKTPGFKDYKATDDLF